MRSSRETIGRETAGAVASGLAIEAAKRAYAPYSGFHVGAVLEDDTGRFHQGCNLECASLGLSLCAERAALARAVTAGATRFKRLWIYTPTERPTPPCGACREMLLHFAADLRIHLICSSRSTRHLRLRELLPGFPAKEAETQ